MVKFFVIILVAVMLVAVPFFLIGDTLEKVFADGGVVSLLREYGRSAWLAAIGLLIADLALPVPTTAVMAALGMIYGPVIGGCVAGLGSVVSGLVGYGLCRHFGRPVAIWLSGAEGLARGEEVFSNVGGWIVALSRWLPVVSEVVACVAGLSRMRFRVFLLALFSGSVPLGFVFAVIGNLGADMPMTTLILSAVLPVGLWVAIRPFTRAL